VRLNSRKKTEMERDWDLRAAEGILYTTNHPNEAIHAKKIERHRRAAFDLTALAFDKLAFTPSGKTMIDIGCGTGRFLPGFLVMFKNVIGVDVSPEMINTAKKANTSSNLITKITNGRDLQGIDNGGVDFAFSYVVFQHIAEKEIVLNYLSEVLRILKPGGIFQLHFRDLKRPMWERIFYHLPQSFGMIAAKLWQTILLLSGRRVSSVSGLFLGNKETWRGSGFSRKEVGNRLVTLGFSELAFLPDKTHVKGARFWVIGRKPTSIQQ